MSDAELDYILQLVWPLLKKQDTAMRKSIQPRDRLIITLRFLSTGESQMSLQYLFYVGQQTISEILEETISVIYYVLKDNYLKFPASEKEWVKIADDFYKEWDFPNCIGCLDGKHVKITPPPDSGSKYFNYHGFHSIVLLGVCDANLRFIYVDVGGQGRISDGGIWDRCSLKEGVVKDLVGLPRPRKIPGSTKVLPFFFVGDDAFPLKSYLMKPFPIRHMADDKIMFNARVSRARRCIENCFGILAEIFLIFSAPMNLKPVQKYTDVVLTCVVLHNFLRTNRITESDSINHFQSEFFPNVIVNADEDGLSVQQLLTDYFFNEGRI